jgi:glycosyltransferase involved in cell wall biosynthesis
MNEERTISVVIPAFNSAGTIARALDSAVSQSRPPDQILVVDDHSSDDTAEIVATFARQGVELIRPPHHRGAGGARNAGVQKASGDLIAFLDSDDEWLPGKLEKQVALIESDARLSFVACGSNLISVDGTDLGDLYHGQPIVPGDYAWKALLACNFIATPAVLVWRHHLIALGGFDESMKIGEDQDLWIRLALRGSLGYVPESLVRVHKRENNLSRWALSDLLTYTLPMVERHISALHERLTAREIRQIRGERLSRFGRVAYARGELADGISLLSRSMLLGYRPLESAWYMATASPPTMWLKRRLGHRTSP